MTRTKTWIVGGMFAIVMSMLVGCGEVSTGPGTGGSAGDSGGTTGSAGQMMGIGGSGGTAVQKVYVQADYDQSLVGTWIGNGISNYSSITFTLDPYSMDHSFFAIHPANSGGGTQDHGGWVINLNRPDLELDAINAELVFAQTVVVNMGNGTVSIPGYVKQ